MRRILSFFFGIVLAQSASAISPFEWRLMNQDIPGTSYGSAAGVSDPPYQLHIFVKKDCIPCEELVRNVKIARNAAGNNSAGWSHIRLTVWDIEKDEFCWKFHLRQAEEKLGNIVSDKTPAIVVHRWLPDSIGPGDGYTIEDFWEGVKDPDWILSELGFSR